MINTENGIATRLDWTLQTTASAKLTRLGFFGSDRFVGNEKPQGMEAIFQSVAEDYVEDFYPIEAPHCYLIWDHLARRCPDKSNADSNFEIVRRPSEIGLPFDGEEFVKLITPTLYLILTGTARKLSTISTKPSLEEIQDVLRQGARQADIPQTFTDELVEIIGPELFDRLQRISMSPGESLQSGISDDFSKCTVSRLINDRYYPPKRYHNGWAERLLSAEQYQILVDERKHTLRIGKADSQLIRSIRRMQRGMLWLVLTHIGDGYITHNDINQTFGLGIRQWDAQQRRAIYQYPVELEKLVGPFYSKMLSEGKSHSYKVNADKWSFCWISCHCDLKQSELYPERKG